MEIDFLWIEISTRAHLDITNATWFDVKIDENIQCDSMIWNQFCFPTRWLHDWALYHISIESYACRLWLLRTFFLEVFYVINSKKEERTMRERKVMWVKKNVHIYVMVSHYSFTFLDVVVVVILFSLKFFIGIKKERKMDLNNDDVVFDSIRIYIIRLKKNEWFT